MRKYGGEKILPDARLPRLNEDEHLLVIDVRLHGCVCAYACICGVCIRGGVCMCVCFCIGVLLCVRAEGDC